MRYLSIVVSICVFGLMNAAVVKGNERHLTATAVAAELVVKEKAEPAAEESIDAGQRRFAMETAIQSLRLSNELYQFEIGTPGTKKVDESTLFLSVDKVKAKLDELGVPTFRRTRGLVWNPRLCGNSTSVSGSPKKVF